MTSVAALTEWRQMEPRTVNGECVRSESGYAMGSLLVSLVIMSVLMSIALPVWNQFAQREREAELVFRGEQYVRAVELYERAYAGALAPDVRTLVEQRFLRRAYMDPMTKDGNFRVVYQAEVNEFITGTESGFLPGQAAGNTRIQSRPEFDQRRSVSEGIRGGVVGVVSESAEASIRIYKGAKKYNEWRFVKDGPSIAFTQGAGREEGLRQREIRKLSQAQENKAGSLGPRSARPMLAGSESQP